MAEWELDPTSNWEDFLPHELLKLLKYLSNLDFVRNSQVTNSSKERLIKMNNLINY